MLKPNKMSHNGVEMSEFLAGEDLSNRIRNVVEGGDVKCAVAFWGDNRFEIAADQMQNWKIACDLSMGATSPEELRRLGAPRNKNLRYFMGLHSKVYISDRGVVVGSANASARALGFDGRPAFLLEAGTFHASDSDVWIAASNWFNGVFDKSSQIDQAALEEAGGRYRPPAINIGRPLAEMTILEQIAAAPDHYEATGIGFVIFGRVNNAEERQNAAQQALVIANAAGIEEERVLNWRARGVFTDWGNLGNLSPRFVAFYLGPNGGRRVDCHEVVLRDAENRNFFTKIPVPHLATVTKDRFPHQLEEADWMILQEIQAKLGDGGAIFTARSFADALRGSYAAEQERQ